MGKKPSKYNNKAAGMRPKERITSQDIEALVDGQLDPVRAARLHAQLSRQPLLNRHYHQLMVQKQQLKLWWAALPRSDNPTTPG